MPKIVDRTARRAEIVDAFLAVARREGLGRATSRAIAAELGVAIGSLWHYFPDFDAVLLAAFDRVYHRTNERIAAATAASTGLAALDAMMREVLPVTPEAQEEAQIVVGYWGRVAAIPELGRTQLAVDDEWHDVLQGRLEEAVLDGSLRPDAPVAAIADLLLALGASQQVEFVTRSAGFSVDRQMELVEHCLRPWRS